MNSELFDAFAEDYKKASFSKEELRNKYDLTHRQYRDFIHEFFNRFGYYCKGNRNPKNIQKLPSGNYRVFKVIDGKFISFGTYSTKENATSIRDKLHLCDWDISQLDFIKREVLC